MNTTLKSCLHLRSISYGILFISSLFFMQTAIAQTAAGKVIFAQGAPLAFNSEGTERGLSRGADLFSGDRLVTDNGRLQIGMLDGLLTMESGFGERKLSQVSHWGFLT